MGFNFKIEYNPEDLEILQEVFVLNRYSSETAMEMIKIPCPELLYKCRWEGKTVPCMRIFQKSITYEGYCCSFNISPYNKVTTGRRTKYFGFRNGLSVILKPNIDTDALTKIFSEGVELLIHESSVFPSDTAVEKLLPIRSETFVSIRTTMTICSGQVKALPISDRSCVFPEEFSLRFTHNIYDFLNIY